jgi:hypothetical protein
MNNTVANELADEMAKGELDKSGIAGLTLKPKFRSRRSENSSQSLIIRNLQRNRLSPFGFALRLIVAALGRRSEMFYNSLLFNSDLCLLDSDYSF